MLILPGLTASAFASGIVYIKDSNVWLSSPDGSVTRQITTDGSAALPYFSPSQADDGTILAGLGTRLHRFDQSGRAVGAPIPTVLTNKPASMLAFGPFSPRISPDGTKVADWIGLMSGSFDPACNCILSMSIEDVVYAKTDGSGTIGFTRWNRSPSWIDNGRVLVFAPDNRQTPQAWIADLASPDTPQGWFNDDGAGFGGLIVNFDQGVLDRAQKRLVVVRGMSDEKISLYSVNGFGTAPTLLACEISGPNGKFADPTLAPDGSGLAWAEADGVWATSQFPADLSTQAACSTIAPKLVFKAASQPFWGSASATPGGPGSSGSQPAPRPGSAPSLSAPSGQRLATIRSRGLAVRITCPGACTATIRALLRGKVLGKATKSRKTAGTSTVLVRLTPRGRTLLRGLRRATLLVMARVTRPSAAALALSQRVVLKR